MKPAFFRRSVVSYKGSFLTAGNSATDFPSSGFVNFPRILNSGRCVCSVLTEKSAQSLVESKVTDEGISQGAYELPEISESKRVILVRHGESTWNATGRIQGSSNFSELTAKGESQAETSRQMLLGDTFDICFHSPLQRSSKTAEIIWDNRQAPMVAIHDLREIDLYSFQGLFKEEGKARFGDAYRMWQKDAANFEIDGHFPVRELWTRAQNCWNEILTTPGKSVLVVAHNAVNQALVATATGLGPEYFRILLQSNCGVSVLDFSPPPLHHLSSLSSDTDIAAEETEGRKFNSPKGGPPIVRLNRLNQTPSPPVVSGQSAGRKSRFRVIFVSHGASDSSFHGRFEASESEKLNMLGIVQSRKTAELLLDIRVDAIAFSSLLRSKTTADAISEVQEAADCLGADCIPRFVDMIEIPELNDFDFGLWKGTPKAEAAGTGRWEDFLKTSAAPGSGETLENLWDRAGRAWEKIREQLEQPSLPEDSELSEPREEGRTVVVVGHETVHEAMVAKSLNLGTESFGKFRFDSGGISVVDFPEGPRGVAVLRCLNYTAHLGRWAVPVTSPSSNDEDF